MTPEDEEIYREMDRLLDLQKSDFEETFNSTRSELKRMNNLIVDTIKVCREQNLDEHEILWNIALYINIAAYDISIAVENIALERRDWERKFSARTSAILLYEVTEDLINLLGKSFRKSLEALNVSDTIYEELKNVQKPLNIYWKTNQAELKSIRVSSYGHRETDSYNLFEIINSINSHKIMLLASELGGLLNSIGPVLQKILVYTSKVRKPSNHVE